MCGIIGYVGSRTAKDLLLQGLERLEYRGYDSAGLCLVEGGRLDYVRAVGNLDQLKEAAGRNGSPATTGLGHTRWATHGKVSIEKRPPAGGMREGDVAVVLNGIVENFRELGESLAADGQSSRPRRTPRSSRTWSSATTGATWPWPCGRRTRELEGHFAFVVIHRDHPDMLVGAAPADVRSWSATATARCSWPPRSPPSCVRRAASS